VMTMRMGIRRCTGLSFARRTLMCKADVIRNIQRPPTRADLDAVVLPMEEVNLQDVPPNPFEGKHAAALRSQGFEAAAIDDLYTFGGNMGGYDEMAGAGGTHPSAFTKLLTTWLDAHAIAQHTNRPTAVTYTLHAIGPAARASRGRSTPLAPATGGLRSSTRQADPTPERS